MQRSPTVEEICAVAKRAISTFKSKNLVSCITGNAACLLYGTSRQSHIFLELDIIVLSEDHPPRKLEEMLTAEDKDFYLIQPKGSPDAPKVLCSKLPSKSDERKRGCKVNVLVPSMLDLPVVQRDRLEKIGDVLVLHPVLLLFTKLRTWSDRRISSRSYMQSTQHNDDVRYISELLSIVRGRGENVSRGGAQWIPMTTMDAAWCRLAEYAEEYPTSKTNLRVIGFIQR
ncbi:uncharacterized protein FIBRA_09159 [Fibroporia radiculosa]|uniref:Uncharacterized protein n=1 Tax=Fibroporia radiculosa TaxID=599839 RepID=J4H5J6_9APHY|nr:uncharacterized protein FIBRA_09159 [Fibroporia radiculosa]CCM06854.1 predicted protein [Fibroporia radiculosa]